MEPLEAMIPSLAMKRQEGTIDSVLTKGDLGLAPAVFSGEGHRNGVDGVRPGGIFCCPTRRCVRLRRVVAVQLFILVFSCLAAGVLSCTGESGNVSGRVAYRCASSALLASLVASWVQDRAPAGSGQPERPALPAPCTQCVCLCHAVALEATTELGVPVSVPCSIEQPPSLVPAGFPRSIDRPPRLS